MWLSRPPAAPAFQCGSEILPPQGRPAPWKWWQWRLGLHGDGRDRYSAQKRQDVHGFEVNVFGQRATEHPMVFTEWIWNMS